MNLFDRRQFLQSSVGAILAAQAAPAQEGSDTAQIKDEGALVRVKGSNYTWEWLKKEDRFRLLDSKGRLITSARLQPAVVVSPAGKTAPRTCTLGSLAAHHVEPGKVRFEYKAVNGAARLSIEWRFGEDAIWTEPVVYDTPSREDVVSLHYFVDIDGAKPKPGLQCFSLIVPGISEGSSVSPVEPALAHLKAHLWLGHGAASSDLLQQWGLPVGYFCGFSIDPPGPGYRDALTKGRSDAFTCGLADLPNGDLLLDMRMGRGGMWIDYRSDLWGHLRGPGQLRLGAKLLWVVGEDFRESIRRYYGELVKAGIVQRKVDSPRKVAAALTPQFCTWGAQVDRDKGGPKLDEAFLTEIYRELKASGMKAGMLSIDDKWESSYGRLEHSEQRLPHFEQFLDQVRAEGHRIGFWAALMRCQDPEGMGLAVDNMLKRPDGKPYVVGSGPTKYYLLDFTQPKVQKTLSEVARRFIRRYKPDLLKFDFGYELPALGVAAPQNMQWAGERLMWKGLDVVIGAMREENPDLVVMYYQLSPLFLEQIDLHSPDDLFLAAGEYDLEANRRFFFSSLLGELGVPTYGSSGYDWQSAPAIWFDSVVVGTLGSLNDFRADERGEGATPDRVAKYNGLVQAIRPSNNFKAIPFPFQEIGSTRAAHAQSWARIENGEVVLLALRPCYLGSSGSSDDPAVKKFQSMVHTKVPVVVASKTADRIATSDRLVVVPFGDDEIVIGTERTGRAEITVHFFGGHVEQSEIAVSDGALHLPAKQRSEAYGPVEWMEVHLSS